MSAAQSRLPEASNEATSHMNCMAVTENLTGTSSKSSEVGLVGVLGFEPRTNQL